VDLASIKAAVAAAVRAGVHHFIYVSVAHPAPVMHAYIAAREGGEALVRSSGIRATILRPWYILGPGHRWPYLLLPILRRIALHPRDTSRCRATGSGDTPDHDCRNRERDKDAAG